MRYQLELDIGLPRARVLDLYLDPENLGKWQPDFVSYEQISGRPRDVGSKSKQVHKMGGREMEMVETITVHNYPDEFAATYESDGVWNQITNRFVEIDAHNTNWSLDAEMKCSGLMIQLMTFFMRWMFKQQTRTFMKRFKEFAEKTGGGEPA